VSVEGSRLVHVAHGVIRPDDKAALSDRLLHLFEAVAAILEEHRPHEAAIEESFVNTNAASTLKLGHARAAAMIAPARAGLMVAEYAATVVKKAVVGTGGADKTQVAFMIRRLLPTAGDPSSDAADALAVAICHAHARTARRGAA
jgi:crossover junction endodeoxyribonuclease RuvC